MVLTDVVLLGANHYPCVQHTWLSKWYNPMREPSRHMLARAPNLHHDPVPAKSLSFFLTGISLRIGHFLKANYDSQNDHSSWHGGITDFHWTILSFSRFLAFFGLDCPSLETTCPPARLALPSPGATLVTPAPPAAPTAPVVDFLSERLGICGKETSPKERRGDIMGVPCWKRGALRKSAKKTANVRSLMGDHQAEIKFQETIQGVLISSCICGFSLKGNKWWKVGQQKKFQSRFGCSDKSRFE